MRILRTYYLLSPNGTLHEFESFLQREIHYNRHGGRKLLPVDAMRHRMSSCVNGNGKTINRSQRVFFQDRRV